MTTKQTTAPWLAGATDADPAITGNNGADAGATPSEGDAAAATPETATPAPDAPAVEVASEVVDMVTVTAPRAFNLRVDNFRVITVPAGVQEMERCLAEHWYSVANGVTIYEPKAPA